LRSKIRSRPKTVGQEYLDMYLMLKEKERWEKFGKSLVKSQERAGDTWREMRKEIIKTKAQLPEHPEGELKHPEGELKHPEEVKEKEVKESKRLPRSVKTIDWNY